MLHFRSLVTYLNYTIPSLSKRPSDGYWPPQSLHFPIAQLFFRSYPYSVFNFIFLPCFWSSPFSYFSTVIIPSHFSPHPLPYHMPRTLELFVFIYLASTVVVLLLLLSILFTPKISLFLVFVIIFFLTSLSSLHPCSRLSIR